MESFFTVKTPHQVLGIINGFEPVGEERVSLEIALGRVVSRDVVSPEDLPGFLRSAMDGYAVRAKDTFGASESLPAFLEVSGEVPMGTFPSLVLEKGKAARISTGGMLPGHADAVVMIEYCHPLDPHTVEVARAVSPLENVIQPGDDFQEGALVLPKGHRLRPQDLGVMAGLGLSHVWVHKQPRVAILSTGDEVVPVDDKPLPGQVRDINQYTLGAFCRRMGAEPLSMGICPDDLGVMKEMVHRSLQVADSLWISGGSSVGARDLTLQVFETLTDFELLVHGISISPGKPTIIGRAGKRPIIGVPGHVASALVVAEVFLSRLIHRLSGLAHEEGTHPPRMKARLSQNIESASGREDYVRVKVEQQGDAWLAKPVFGKSGLISILVESDGLVRVDMNTEGLYHGDMVEVLLFD